MQQQLTLAHYASILRQRWLLITSIAIVGLILGLLWSMLQTPLYTARATVLVDAQSSTQVLDPLTGQQRAERRITNETKFLQSDQVRDTANAKLQAAGVAYVPEDRQGHHVVLRALEGDESDEIHVIAEAESANDAAAIAQEYAQTYIDVRRDEGQTSYRTTAKLVDERINTLESNLVSLPADSPRRSGIERSIENLEQSRLDLNLQIDLVGQSATVIRQAEPPLAPFAPQFARNIMVTLVLGAVLGTVLAILLDTLDSSIRDKQHLESLSGATTLGVIPVVKSWRDRSTTRIETLASPSSATSEAYRGLRTSIEFASISGDDDDELRTLQITSANPGDGKTTTSVNLAVAMASAGKRVILLDADLRKPRLHSFFGAEVEPGFTNLLLGWPIRETILDAGCGPGSLKVIPSGPLPPGPTELLGSKRALAMIDELKSGCDLLILDSPPVLPVSDALVIAKSVDATLLVANATSTKATAIQAASEQLHQVGARVLGTVLNQASPRNRGYGYGYGYGYGDPQVDDSPNAAAGSLRTAPVSNAS